MQNYTEKSQIPLPNNWSVCLLDDGRKIFVDHVNKMTTWTDPRDSLTKPQTFADCIGDELPYGWEISHDPSIGKYFIDHNSGVNQVEDPRDQWRYVQESMIQYYLKSAKESIEAKEKILLLKRERATLVDQELSHLMTIFQKINEKNQRDHLSSPCTSNLGSKNSLATASSSCSLYSKYDPDLLRTNISKRAEYSLCEKDSLESELVNLKKLLLSIEEEKSTLVNQVAELWRDLQGDCQKSDSQLDFPLEKASCSSQTDIIESVHSGNRIAALARARLRYNELKCLLYTSHQQLAALNEKMLPADLELDHDQISLIHEKEQLLRELKTVCYDNDNDNAQQQQCSENLDDPRYKLTEKMHELEEDLRLALRLSREEMSQRSRILRKKEDLEHKIYEAGLSLAKLEQQLKSLSASTLSTSSLSTNSTSCGSLSPYSGADTAALNDNIRSTSKMYDDIRKRVEQLVGPTSVYNHTMATTNAALSSRDSIIHRENSVGSSGGYRMLNNIVLTICEAATLLEIIALVCSHTHCNCKSGVMFLLVREFRIWLLYPGRNLKAISDTGYWWGIFGATKCPIHPSNRSMSAAVSDESVAGDSGVFEAGGGLKRPSVQNLNQCNGVNNAQLSPSVAQIMVTLNFDSKLNKLYVTLEKTRSLSYLFNQDIYKTRSLNNTNCLSPDSQSGSLRFRGSLLPCLPGDNYTFVTDWISIAPSNFNDNVDRSVSKQAFEFNISLRSIRSKILQLYVFGQVSADSIDCLGEAQLNLAEFNCQMIRSQWVNILNRQFLTIPSTPESMFSYINSMGKLTNVVEEKQNSVIASQSLNWENCQAMSARRLNTLKEESSDESTVIPSQASTLTRNIDSLIEEPLFECSPLGHKTPTLSANICAKSFSCLRLTINDSDSSDSDEENSSRSSAKCEKQTNTDFPQPCCSSNVDEEKPNDNSLSSKDGDCSATKANNLCKSSFSSIRKLSRSGSDTNVALHKREPFKRNIIERRSLRWRKTQPNPTCSRRLSSSIVGHSHQSSSKTCDHYRTSIDLNIDLETAKLRLERKKEDVNALLLMKEQLNQRRKDGLVEANIPFTSHMDKQSVINRVIQNNEKLRNISSVMAIIFMQNSYFKKFSSIRTIYVFRDKRFYILRFVTTMKIMDFSSARDEIYRRNEEHGTLSVKQLVNSKISSLVNTSEAGVNIINLIDNDCEEGVH
uniref:WW domain-containing protein n=1 Tax=Romanomermis culicivorax TaxID=13658 RepID=A0A915L630_ROMCU